MVSSYVQRCQYYFPQEFNCADFDEASIQVDLIDERGAFQKIKSGYFAHERGRGHDIMLQASRDIWIGKTAIHAFLDGLEQKKGELTDEIMLRHSTFAKATATGKFVPEKGIHKTHAGLWRTSHIVQAIEDRSEAQTPLLPQTEVKRRESPFQITSRIHADAVTASSFRSLQIKYQALKGDHLKQQILLDFKEKIESIYDINELHQYIQDFKNSDHYRALKTPQGSSLK